MSKNGVFLPFRPNNGNTNMDLDERLLNFAIKNDWQVPVLRFYGWAPACVSLGRNQDDEDINKVYCAEHGIDIVRRLTGGRALFHDDELTYSFVCPSSFLKSGETVLKSYKEISGALAAGFKRLGIELGFPETKKASTNYAYCMSLSTGADLSFCGKKIVGSAQYRKHNYILQHGSILFSYDTDKIKNIFGEEPEQNKITTLRDILPGISGYELCNALKKGMEEYFSIEFDTIRLQDQSEEFLLRQDICV